MFRLCFVYCVRLCQGSSLQDAKLAGHLLVCFAQSCLAKQLSEKSEKQFHFVFCVCLAIFDVRLRWVLVSGKHVRQCLKKFLKICKLIATDNYNFYNHCVSDLKWYLQMLRCINKLKSVHWILCHSSKLCLYIMVHVHHDILYRILSPCHTSNIHSSIYMYQWAFNQYLIQFSHGRSCVRLSAGSYQRPS